MNSNTIKDMEVKLFSVPLREVVFDALHGEHTNFDLITVTLTLEDGRQGTGYTYTGGRGGYAIACMIDKDLRKYIIGKTLENPRDLCYSLDKTLHYVGRGGILSFAISAVDIAAWDIFAKTQNKPLHEIIVGKSKTIKTYHGGIDLGYTEEKLLSSIEAQLKKGHNAVKIKVGKEDYHEDIARLKAVRKLIGDKNMLMMDANMVLDLETAKALSYASEECGVFWFEEPMNPDDIISYGKLAEATNVPLAMGENLHTFFEHKNAVEIGKVTYLQPDASNIRGITGWLDVANMAKEKGLVVSTHGMQELHINLLACVENPGFMEYHTFPIDDYTVDPLIIKNGTIEANSRPGVGVEFDWKKLEPYKV